MTHQYCSLTSCYNQTHNDGDVKIIVGNNSDEIVLDELKDVLILMREFYFINIGVYINQKKMSLFHLYLKVLVSGVMSFL